MCAVCFTAAQVVPAAAAAGRAMFVRRGMRKLNDETAALDTELEPVDEERVLSSV